MINLSEKRKELKAKVDEARGILTVAQSENRSLTSEEQGKYDSVFTEIDNRKKEILNVERLQDAEMGAVDNRTESEKAEQRQELEHFIKRAYEFSNGEKRDLNINVGAQGGVLVPPEFSKTFLMIEPKDAIIRPRAQLVGSGSDAEETWPALDQSGANGVYGGVVVNWLGENAQSQQSDPTFRDITLKPERASAFTRVSKYLLKNNTGAGALIEKLLRGAVISAQEAAFISGDGVGKPTGIIGHPASINVARTGAGAIVYADIVNMYASLKMGGQSAFVISQSVLPQLMSMVDGGGHLVWQPNAREGAPGTLLGIPTFISTHSPALGSQGDVMLVDLGYYLIKDGSGMELFFNPYSNSRNQQTDIQIDFSVDGQPWLTTPLLLEDGVTQVSPFVVLQ